MKNIFILFILFALIFTNCTKPTVYNDPIPKHDSLTIYSKILKEDRKINIYIPENYVKSKDSFPVLYMPDGGLKEDFPHIANTLQKLIAEKKIPGYILVGIENTKRKRDLTGITTVEKDKEIADEVGKSANFRKFINEELIPQINKNYKTNSYKGIIGESLAGFFVVETFLLEPNDFDFYIAFDPSLWWNNHHYDKNVAQFTKNLPEKNTKIWFASSNAEGMAKAARNLEKNFKTIAPQKLTWSYSNEPKEEHQTIFRATKEKAIIWTLNQK
jgi:predicted alpha/beta superfamily hydrolase